jgi:hypothetical protein
MVAKVQIPATRKDSQPLRGGVVEIQVMLLCHVAALLWLTLDMTMPKVYRCVSRFDVLL